jgi:dienelactone hydrolase
MQLTSLALATCLALCAPRLALSREPAGSSLEQPYRVLLPSGGVAPQPAVMLVPGCSGFAAHNGVNLYEERATELQAAGYAVVFVDYIGRHMQSNCAHVSPTEVSSEIFEAVAWTKRQPRIDANRISVIGWSFGGRGVLAALKAMPTDAPIAKAVMYYPVCRGAASWSTSATGLMLLGAMDDIAHPGLCDAVVKEMSPDKLRVITYPNARHGFDMRGLPDRSDHLPGTPAYNPEAAKASWSVTLEFLKNGPDS